MGKRGKSQGGKDVGGKRKDDKSSENTKKQISV